MWYPAIREGVVLINLSNPVFLIRDGLAGRGQRAAVVEGVLEHEAVLTDRVVGEVELLGEVVPRPLRALGPVSIARHVLVADPFIDTFAVLVHPRITTIRDRVRILRHGEERSHISNFPRSSEASSAVSTAGSLKLVDLGPGVHSDIHKSSERHVADMRFNPLGRFRATSSKNIDWAEGLVTGMSGRDGGILKAGTRRAPVGESRAASFEEEKEVRADPLASYRAPIDTVQLASSSEFDSFKRQCVKPSEI